MSEQRLAEQLDDFDPDEMGPVGLDDLPDLSDAALRYLSDRAADIAMEKYRRRDWRASESWDDFGCAIRDELRSRGIEA